MMGCMLYWAEGTKSRNTLALANTDVSVLQTFLHFLRKCYGVTNADLTVRIVAHTDFYSEEEIESFWVRVLGIEGASMTEHEFNPPKRQGRNPRKSTTRTGKRPYGTCTLRVRRSTEMVQSIYGGICEYAGLPTQEEWLNGYMGT